MAPTPSSKPVPAQVTPSKTPQSKHRLHLPSAKNTHPSPNPTSVAKETPPAEHPIEVIGRIRDYPDQNEKPFSALQISPDGQMVRVRTDIGYRDFTLDGVSVSMDEDLDGFYKKFVESRINGVKLGAKCTIMMYGPTGSGKSHTMFGCPKQPGIVYRALRDILGGGDEENGAVNGGFGIGTFVQVAVLEIYNEEIYDLLSSNSSGVGIGWAKGTASKVRLEVMGGKAKNATFISGNEAGKLSKEVARVEKRRIVKSTLCNERSSRSHCMIILDVPLVGGRLMLVDMAGSENIEQAGQTGFEAKMQTAKINQGNIALKRVVESIANGDSYVPFRDSKLTMLLQDSFEDDKSKILMILCASPDPKEMHKTISTLEYGAKAKCIIRSSHTPNAKDKVSLEHSSSTVLGLKIAAMDQFILKLQMENKLREKERDEAHKELLRKEKEVAELRAKLELVEEKRQVTKDEEISSKVDERTQILKAELQKKLYECQQMESGFDKLGRKMEEKILQQQEEVEMLRRRLEEIEAELCNSTEEEYHGAANDIVGNSFIKRLSEIYPEGEQEMEKSMDLDMGEEQPVLGVKEIRNQDVRKPEKDRNRSSLNSHVWAIELDDIAREKFAEKVCLSTVFEGKEEENTEEEEVEKEVIEEKSISFGNKTDGFSNINMSHPPNLVQTPTSCVRNMDEKDCSRKRSDNAKDSASARRTRIQNIFMLCGNHREAAHVGFSTPSKKRSEAADNRSSPVVLSDESVTKPNLKKLSPLQTFALPEHRSYTSFLAEGTTRNITESPISAFLEPFSSLNMADEQKLTDTQLSKKCSSSEKPQEMKGDYRPNDEDGLLEVYVKWEASKENPGKIIPKLKVLKNSTLADLRKLVETHLIKGNSQQAFAFLMLGDPAGAPVVNEKEATIQASKLPICNSHISSHLACLRPIKKAIQRPNHLPFSSLENKLSFASNNLSMMDQGEGFSPKTSKKFSSTPFVTGLKI